ncbi:MAG: ribulose-phosphate 3-epimerase [Patescibacteria group bacterium]
MPLVLSASVMCADLLDLKGEALRLQKAGIDWLHIDVMDGHFVPNLTFGAALVSGLRAVTGLCLDVHLMLAEPERHAAEFARLGGDPVTFHVEASAFPLRVIRGIKSTGARAGVAINPATPVECLTHLVAELDLVLVMAVEPGFAGQACLPGMADKVARVRRLLREAGSGAAIGVDGNINPATIPALVAAGADLLVGGSSGLFIPGKDPAETAAAMRAAAGAGLALRRGAESTPTSGTL